MFETICLQQKMRKCLNNDFLGSMFEIKKFFDNRWKTHLNKKNY